MEQITRRNGNGHLYSVGLPKIVWCSREINDVALAHVADNTGLIFTKTAWGYEAQPTMSQQIAALLMTYNFKTKYYNNADYKNELHLKGDGHVGFDVDSICFDCVKANHLHVGNLQQGDRLAC